MPQTPREHLERSSLFGHLSSDQLDALAAHCTWRSFPAKEVVVKERDDIDALYLIAAGSAQVSTHAMSRQVELKQLGPGAFFGEVSLLSGKQATATVQAGLQGVECVLVEREALLELVAQDGGLREALEDITLARAKDTIAKVLG